MNTQHRHGNKWQVDFIERCPWIMYTLKSWRWFRKNTSKVSEECSGQLRLASSLGSPSPFLTNFIRKKLKERESLVKLAKVLVATHSIVRSTALALPSGPCLLH